MNKKVWLFLYRVKQIPSNVKAWFWNGFVNRTHLVKVREMKFGQWSDLDYKMFHANFSMLVEFVEQELAINSTARKYGRENGLAHLDWEIDLVNDPTVNPWEREMCRAQSENAKVVKELYLWYKDIRPARPDPDDLWSVRYPRANRKMEGNKYVVDKQEDEADCHALIEQAWKIEKQYDEEDTEKLITLIRIRHSLWT